MNSNHFAKTIIIMYKINKKNLIVFIDTAVWLDDLKG